jgi:hypothetical protein
VSVETLNQAAPAHPVSGEELATLVIHTHTAPEANLAETVKRLADLPVVALVSGVVRVEGS